MGVADGVLLVTSEETCAAIASFPAARADAPALEYRNFLPSCVILSVPSSSFLVAEVSYNPCAYPAFLKGLVMVKLL
jgi:hypothetical protein